MSKWPGKKHVGISVIFVNMIALNDAYNAKERVGHVYHNRKWGKSLISSKKIIF